jgi:L-ectoine synthase
MTRRPVYDASEMEVKPVIVRTFDELAGTDRDVAGQGWSSRRLLLRADGMGYSLHDTTVEAGGELDLEYRHHLEGCYIMSGEGEVTDLATGAKHPLAPGTVYALDQHDRHTVRAFSDLRMVCVFNPPLVGTERHVGGGYESSPTA